MRDIKPPSRIAAWVFLLAALLAALACSPAAPVVQGQVVSVDTAGKTMVVQDETKPGGEPLTYDISKAEIGAEPVPGDMVRMVYRVEGGRNVALRVMNLTQQKERDKKGN